MKPDRIVLVRHGQSVGNVNKEIYKEIPDYALQLSEEGKAQAVEAGRRFRELIGDESFKCYVSPFWRTRQTYLGMMTAFPSHQKTSKEFYEDPRLREQEWAGALREDGYMEDIESERDSFGHFYYRFDRGESCADVFDRISSFLDTLHRDFEKTDFPRNCLIVTHGMTLRVFLMRFFHLSVEEFERLRNPKNCQMVVLERAGEKYKLVNGLEEYPDVSHKYQFDWTTSF